MKYLMLVHNLYQINQITVRDILLKRQIFSEQSRRPTVSNFLYLICPPPDWLVIRSVSPIRCKNLSPVGYIVFKSDLESFLNMKTPIVVIWSLFCVLQLMDRKCMQYIVIPVWTPTSKNKLDFRRNYCIYYKFGLL